MGIFGAIVSVAVDTIKLPFDIAHDVISLGGAIDNNGKSHTVERLDEIKKDAQKDSQ